MKKVLTSILAIALLATMLLTLASCAAKPKGKYGSSLLNLEFDGSKVTVNVINVIEVNGTYEMGDDGEIVITYENDEGKGKVPTNLVYDADNDTIKCKLGSIDITLEKVKD